MGFNLSSKIYNAIYIKTVLGNSCKLGDLFIKRSCGLDVAFTDDRIELPIQVQELDHEHGDTDTELLLAKLAFGYGLLDDWLHWAARTLW